MRADLHIGRSRDGQLCITTTQGARPECSCRIRTALSAAAASSVLSIQVELQHLQFMEGESLQRIIGIFPARLLIDTVALHVPALRPW
jgi:hypothetical protein